VAFLPMPRLPPIYRPSLVPIDEAVHSLGKIGHLNGTRTIVDVVFSYANRNTDFTEKYSVPVDVTEKQTQCRRRANMDDPAVPTVPPRAVPMAPRRSAAETCD
jgi:hypothetical protein